MSCITLIKQIRTFDVAQLNFCAFLAEKTFQLVFEIRALKKLKNYG